MSVFLDQTADSVAGKVSIGGPVCMPSADVFGLATGTHLVLTAISGEDSLFVDASFDATSMVGTFSANSGVCAGASVDFSLRKQGSFVHTLATGIGFLPGSYSNVHARRSKLAVRGGNVYWYDSEARCLKKAGAGGGAEQILASGFDADFAPLALDDDNVYVADSWVVKKVPQSGGSADSLAVASYYISDVAVDGQYVYWVDQQPLATVHRVHVDGGADEYLGSGDKAGQMFVANGFVYWTSHDDTILRVSTSGGVVETVASGLSWVLDLVSDGTFVYFFELNVNAIRRVPVAGGPVTNVGAVNRAWAPYVLTLDGSSIYWINQAEVGTMLKAGGGSKIVQSLLVVNVGFPESIAVEGTSLFWTETLAGAIHRMDL